MVPTFLLLVAGEAPLIPVAPVFKGDLSSGLYRIKLFIGKKSLMDSTGKITDTLKPEGMTLDLFNCLISGQCGRSLCHHFLHDTYV